jgi:hypothetical protein
LAKCRISANHFKNVGLALYRFGVVGTFHRFISQGAAGVVWARFRRVAPFSFTPLASAPGRRFPATGRREYITA